VVHWQWWTAGSRWHWRLGPDWLTLTFAYGVVTMIVATLAAATVPLLPAKACMGTGFARMGDLVGQGSDRIYLGEAVPAPRRIASFPSSDVQQLFIGASASTAVCDPVGQYGPVLAHAATNRARRKLGAAADALGALAAASRIGAARHAAGQFASVSHQAVRSTLTAAEAGGIMNDTIRENHPDEAGIIGETVIGTREAAHDARQALKRLDRALATEIDKAVTVATLQRRATVAIESVRLAVEEAKDVEAETYRASPVLVPLPD
jgi:hypothetical protein